VQALRAAGHDVGEAAEIRPGAPDPEVAEWALEQDRVLVTEDRDFGRLVYAFGQRTVGVIYIRWPYSARRALRRVLAELVTTRGTQLRGTFTVVSPRGIRLRRPPGR
jgi:predicted nuclease of predicted toxin-antitoxin system